MDYWHPDTLIFSAAVNGYSDLFKYHLKTRQSSRITEDFYDDLDVSVVTLDGEKGILFSSNRLDTILEKKTAGLELPLENSDIYFMHPTTTGWSLNNLTRTRFVKETQPILTDKGVISLATSANQLHRKIFEPVNGPVTFSILPEQRIVTRHTAAAGESYVAYIADGKQRITKASGQIKSQVHTDNRDAQGTAQAKTPAVRDTMDITDPRYLFQAPFSKPEAPLTEEPIIVIEPEEPVVQDEAVQPGSIPVQYNPERVIEFRPVRAIAHRLRFKLDYVTTTMDNSLLFTSLDSYAGTNQEYDNPPLGILLKANLKDLFEDYIIEGGARFPTSFNGSEYFLYLDDLKKRFDKRYAFYRKTNTHTESTGPLDIDRTQNVTVIGQYRLSYPFDTYTSLRGTLTFRNDRFIQLATDASNLNTPVDDEQRLGLKLEFVYDNTVEWDINSRHGTRYKIWTEVVKKFDLNLFESGQALTFNEGFMTVFGMDARHYQPLDKHSVLAVRLFASTTLGSERILYYLGGVENWLFSNFDNTIPVPGDKNFAYQSIAANMRGFNYNARNGSSVALINGELRVPFLRYLSRGKLRSAFLRNLQAVGFVDVGTAWHGRDPFSDENPLNTLTLTNPPTVRVDVKYFRNPVIVGYGMGVRAMLFGYYFKLDYAWGLETGRRLDPKVYLSIGLDF
jgi:hypothetical protein